MRKENSSPNGVDRRLFLKFLGGGIGASVLSLETACRFLEPARPDDNPLWRRVSRHWEKIYHDQYRYDRSFDWVCSPNDTHACRIRAYVRNGIVVRTGATYDYQDYTDLYGNKAWSVPPPPSHRSERMEGLGRCWFSRAHSGIEIEVHVRSPWRRCLHPDELGGCVHQDCPGL
jgi:hypothetical protein